MKPGFLLDAHFFFFSGRSEYPGNVGTDLACKGKL